MVAYLKGGAAPQRDYFYWELHENKPIQATRFGNWKAVRNGIDKPIELYDLDADRAESNNLADSHPDLVQHAKQIFAEAHRTDPNWPLDKISDLHARQAAEAWAITRERVKNQYIPPNAR